MPRDRTKRRRPGRRLLRRWRRWTVGCVGLFVVGAALLGAARTLFPFRVERLEDYPASVRVFDDEGDLLRVYRNAVDEMRFPVDLDEISPWLQQATVAVEDRRFRSHPGVDVLAALRAAAQNIAAGRVVSGASTITQQLVRILDGRERTLWTKVIESFHALEIESRLDKDAILRAYLNLAPYGGNLKGVEAASLRYFGKSARDLGLGEAALLAGLPQSPSRLRPDRYYERALERRRTVLRAMLRDGRISRQEHRAALQSRPPVRLHPWPFEAPHFADIAVAAAGGRRLRRDHARVRTTLRRAAQDAAAARLRAYMAERPIARRHLGGAVVVLEVDGGEVRALVGSPGYFDRRRHGQVNGALAPRSSGSVLKPFLYALAYDTGVAAPSTYLADVPTAFRAYGPANFDERHQGPVAAATALSLSLNVPAVRLQERLGTDSFLSLLRDLGLGTLERGAGHYGLTLCLGGGEVRLLDLVNAYAALSRLGEYASYRLLATDASSRGAPLRTRRLFSAAAGFLTVESLSAAEHLLRVAGTEPRPVAGQTGYKTGTSFGLRDAWAIAFNREMVVGVWLGDPRGRPDPSLVGLEAPAPLALAVLGDVSSAAVPLWSRPDDLHERTVCALSGYPATRDCSARRQARFSTAALALPPCDVHRRVMVDPERGHEICQACRPAGRGERRVVETWPAEVAHWFRRQRVDEHARRHDPSCPGVRAAGRPSILSPQDGVEYGDVAGQAQAGRLRLAAASAADSRRLHWFVDGQLFGTASASSELAWPLHPGEHEIRCVDDQGRAAAVRFRVTKAVHERR